MIHLTQSTKPKSAKDIKREWHLIDAKGKILGRIATEISKLLQGKHKVDYVPYLDNGDYVVVINASKVKVSGKKYLTKNYTRYSGYPGGLKIISFEKLMKDKPTEVIIHAVSGMLPKNKLREKRLKRLLVFADDRHPYGDKIKIQNANLKMTN